MRKESRRLSKELGIKVTEGTSSLQNKSLTGCNSSYITTIADSEATKMIMSRNG